ncbi:MBL fold metallo-hydrolase [Pseudonocardia kongjuensis]|uniref:MBL fold metallo-hydrolase n=1 Tax=Pseudonocardia kongjuensis TaxID=102227 RepID=A0ABN1XYB0_9PSEU
MPSERVAAGVWRVPTSGRARDNAFLVAGDEGLTLVDVGWASAPGVIAAAVAELGRELRDVRRIVLTHAHPDHVQGAAEMRERTGAELAVHEADAPWLPEGRVPRGGRSGTLGAIVDLLPKAHWRPFTADRTLVDGETVDGLAVIHTPGHSPGHIVLRHLATGTLLVGDAVFHHGRTPGQGPGALAADVTTRDASLRRLPLDVTAVGFAHGRPLTGDGVATYRDWLGSKVTRTPGG